MAKRARITAKSKPIQLTHQDSHLDQIEIVQYRRPITREECAQIPRPCPFIGCRHHLYLDETEAGNVYLNFPDTPLLEMKHSCALDLADKGPWSLRETSQILGLTPERIRQIETGVIERLRYTELTKNQPSARNIKPYSITHLLLHPKCKTLILQGIEGAMNIDKLYKALTSIIQGSISIIKLRAFIGTRKKQTRKKEAKNDNVLARANM